MKQASIHTEPTKYLHDNNTWLYNFIYAFLYGFVHNYDYTYDLKLTKKVNILPITLYTYDTFSILNYDYDYFCGDMNKLTLQNGYFSVSAASSGVFWKHTATEFETGFDYFGARYYMSDLSIWFSVDPLSDEYPNESPYMYCAANPIMLVDPTGMNYNPVYGSDGSYKGDTKEGFTGEVIIYDGNKDFSNMSANELLYNESFDIKTQKGEANTYDRVRNDLTGDAKSKIWTNIASKMEGMQIYDETFSMSNLVDGKVYFDENISGNWESAYVLGTGKGKISGSDKYSYETTVENIQSSLGAHEYYSHIKKNQGDKFGSHRLAYKNVINYKPLWDKTTDAYKGFNMRNLLKYTRDETHRKEVYPLYRNLYEKYKNKR